MATYNTIIKKRNAANNGWDSILPITLAENVLTDSNGGTVALHLADDVKGKKDPHGIYTELKQRGINPFWYGAKGDGLADDTLAIQDAIDAAYTGTLLSGVVLIPPGKYNISATINLPQGITLIGYGATFRATSSTLNPMIKVYNRQFPANPPHLPFNILGLRFDGDNILSRNIPMCILIDRSFVVGEMCVIRDVSINWFIKGVEIERGARMILFDGVKINAKNYGINIFANDGIFTGDMWFTNVQIETENGIACNLSCVGNGSSMAGFHFNDCVFYGTCFKASCDDTTAWIKDIFMSNMVCDGRFDYTPLISFAGSAANSSSGIFQLSNLWINAGFAGVAFTNVYGGKIIGGKITSIDTIGVLIDNSNYCDIVDVTFHDCNRNQSGGGTIKLTGLSTKCKVLGNSIFNSKNVGDQIIVAESGTSKCIIKNNVTDGTTPVFNQGVNNVITDNVGA